MPHNWVVQHDDIAADVQRLISARGPLQEDEVWAALEPFGDEVAGYLAAAYDAEPTRLGRERLVHHSIGFARRSEAAYRLGVTAIDDYAREVRCEAIALLAYSLRPEAAEVLTPLLEHADGDTRDEALAALQAIDAGNHHFFRDRDQTGRILWIVNPEDEPEELRNAGPDLIDRVKAKIIRLGRHSD